jgi:hypothetical protein
MALTVETGLIVAGADSYISVADASTYHTNRGNAAWAAAASDAVREQALRNATAYIDGHYRQRWKGQPVYPTTQPLEWPRVGVKVVDQQQYFYDVPPSFYDSALNGFLGITVIPQRLKDATCEAALRALAGPLAIDTETGIVREKIDVLETEYARGAVPGQTTYQVIDQLLSDFLKSKGTTEIVRG